MQIALVHDRCNYDGVLLKAFNDHMNDPTFSGREYFSTIASQSWENCIPLQAADLLAYETFKEAQRSLTSRPRRRTLSLLLEAGLGGRAKHIDADGVRKFRLMLEGKWHPSGRVQNV